MSVAIFGSRLDPLPCPTCDGEREIQFKTCSHGGACPCDTRYTRCPDCLKTPGYQTCETCREFPAIGADQDGDSACRLCLTAEADERGAA